MKCQESFEHDLDVSAVKTRREDSRPHSVLSAAWPKKNMQSRGTHHPNKSLLLVHPHTAISVCTLDLDNQAELTFGLGGAFLGLQASFTTLSIFWLDILKID
jgi:hypothetical protein